MPLCNEAVTCVLDGLFATGLHKVSADCDARNHASAGLLKRLGFRREGHRVEHTFYKGEWSDDLLFGLLEFRRGGLQVRSEFDFELLEFADLVGEQLRFGSGTGEFG